MTAAEQAPHPRAGPAQAASNQPVSSSVEIDKTPQFHWVDIDPLPPSPLYSNRRRASIKGSASYWSYKEAENGIGSYENPIQDMNRIKACFGFDQKKGFRIKVKLD